MYCSLTGCQSQATWSWRACTPSTKQCLADVGYACRSVDQRTFIILWQMPVDSSSDDKKLLIGTAEDMGGDVIHSKCSWLTGSPCMCYNSLILESALTQWDWLHCTEATQEQQLIRASSDNTEHLCSRLWWMKVSSGGILSKKLFLCWFYLSKYNNIINT